MSVTAVRGTTRPHRGTWLIWSILAIVVCLSQRADGASWSLIMAAAQAVLTGAVFLLSIRRGEGGLSPADVLMITLAGGGVIGWIIADEPVIATACVVAADLIGAGNDGAQDLPRSWLRDAVNVRARQPQRRATARAPSARRTPPCSCTRSITAW